MLGDVSMGRGAGSVNTHIAAALNQVRMEASVPSVSMHWGPLGLLSLLTNMVLAVLTLTDALQMYLELNHFSPAVLTQYSLQVSDFK